MSSLVKAPKWWAKRHHPAALALAPLGFLYGLGVKLRFALSSPYRSALPVICVGNFTVGGGGKTPLAVAIANLLQEAGHKPVFLTRGYGGETKGPHLVDLAKDNAVTVGDEPLILALTAPVVVCADRAKGARFIEGLQNDVIIMDDGFQNPSLEKDLTVVVVDQTAGIGNGRVFPAGPLRASLSFQLPKADMLVISGTGAQGDRSKTAEIEGAFSRDIIRGNIIATGETDWLKGARVLAMTGIAQPEKFYTSLEQLGAKINSKHDFPDHHMFSEQDAGEMLKQAKAAQAIIIMTKKDWVRLSENGELGRLRKSAKVLEVELQIDPGERLADQLEKTMSSFEPQYSD